MPFNRPDRPLGASQPERDGEAELRERDEGAHAEQDALTDPDATAGPPPDETDETPDSHDDTDRQDSR